MRKFDVGENLVYILFTIIILIFVLLGRYQNNSNPKSKNIIKTYTIEDGDTITIGTQIIDGDE